ncbi:MAG: tRNA (guanosine(37)-N1)-methyltransferase TrmD [Pseudomonadota bacterium]
MRIDVLTIFPDMVEQGLRYGVIDRARQAGTWHLKAWNLRDYAGNRYGSIDDRPFGGGPGMVMRPEPLESAYQAVCAEAQTVPHFIYLSPQGQPLNQSKVIELATRSHIVLLAGRYEGVDERFLDMRVNEEISLGDYVLTGGELPAMVLIDAVVRQLPGVLEPDSLEQESFVRDCLDCPHYTRPRVYNGVSAPEVLFSGDHEAIRQWRLKQSLGRTWLRRPDLLERNPLAHNEKQCLEVFKKEHLNLHGNSKKRDT